MELWRKTASEWLLWRETVIEWLLWSCGLEWRHTGNFCLVMTLSTVTSETTASLCLFTKLCRDVWAWSVHALLSLQHSEGSALRPSSLVERPVTASNRRTCERNYLHMVPDSNQCIGKASCSDCSVPKFVTHKNPRTQWNSCCKMICFATRPSIFSSTAMGKAPSPYAVTV